MEHPFWRERWQAGQIGFHEGRPNQYLAAHASRLPPGGRVLMPLCGKAVDLAHLAGAGHTVVGVELVEDAVAAFFAEQGLSPTRTPVGDAAVYQAGPITVIAGDWFATTAAQLGAIDAVYDRAALIALPPPMRARYVAHLRTVAPTAPVLLVTVDYPQEAMAGPPFAVGDAEVRTLHAGRAIAILDDQPGELPRLAGTGAVIRERCYWIA